MEQVQSTKRIIKREYLNKLGLLIFGLILLPSIIYGLGRLIFSHSSNINLFYGNFYGSLLELSEKGLLAWGVVFIPYVVYESYLLMQKFGYRSEKE